jgi:hypothetical protein
MQFTSLCTIFTILIVPILGLDFLKDEGIIHTIVAHTEEEANLIKQSIENGQIKLRDDRRWVYGPASAFHPELTWFHDNLAYGGRSATWFEGGRGVDSYKPFGLEKTTTEDGKTVSNSDHTKTISRRRLGFNKAFSFFTSRNQRRRNRRK